LVSNHEALPLTGNLMQDFQAALQRRHSHFISVLTTEQMSCDSCSIGILPDFVLCGEKSRAIREAA